MPYEDEARPAIARSPLPSSLVYHCKMVIEQPADDVLLVRTSVWTRVAFFSWTVIVCAFAAPFLISLYSSLTIENYSMSDDMTPFAWLAVIVVLVHFLLVLATLLLRPTRFDRTLGTIGRGGWVPGWWQRDYCDVIAVQICRGKSWQSDQSRNAKPVPQYQLNLVLIGSPPNRRNLSEQKDLRWAERAAKQIANYLKVPVLNYVRAVDETDAEAARLLARRVNCAAPSESA